MKYFNAIKSKASFTTASLFVLTIALCGFYVTLEWLFIVTKPSFLTLVSFGEKIIILFFTTSTLIIFASIIQLPAYLLASAPVNGHIQKLARYYGALLPTFLISSISLLIFDNFTYTLLGFGLVTITSAAVRSIYLVVFILLNSILYIKILDEINKIDLKIKNNSHWSKLIFMGCLLLFLIGSILIPYTQAADMRSATSKLFNVTKASSTPNIVFISVEGLNASHMSFYGYDRKTTPFLDSIRTSFLYADNAFTNSSTTTGSIVSILTGKYPTDTRTLHRPDVLRDMDAREHLPGLLKSLGYYTAQYSFRYYVDAYDINLQNGFIEANGKFYEKQNVFLRYIDNNFPSTYSIFLKELYNRITQRLAHIFFIAEIENIHTMNITNFGDDKKIDAAISLLTTQKQPVFVHIHWMNSHGALFFPAEQFFSRGKDLQNQTEWDPDIYDDCILEFDSAIKKLYTSLQVKGVLENTIIIITADHGQKWVSVERLPLLIRFPNQQYAQVIEHDSQYLDIMPTILDFMGISHPYWVAGESLLQPSNSKPVISVSVKETGFVGQQVYINPKPPFYQFKRITALFCGKWVQMNLSDLKIDQGMIPGSTTNCGDTDLTQAQAVQLFIDHLSEYGYDTSTLEEFQKQLVD